MTRFLTLFVRILLLAVAAGCFAAADAASPLVDARLSVALVQSNGPFETTGPATAARPGDVLEYVARYSNRGTAPAEGLMPTMPLPVGTEYVPTPNGAGPKPTQASLDAITYAAIPLRRKQAMPDGTVRDVDVPLSEYRALRWSVGTLAAGSELTVRARVRVSPPVASPVASR